MTLGDSGGLGSLQPMPIVGPVVTTGITNAPAVCFAAAPIDRQAG